MSRRKRAKLREQAIDQAIDQVKNFPVQKNEYIELTISGLSHEGLGIGKIEGYTLFVRNALPDEKVKVKVINTKKKFGFARMIEILEPSKHRVAPPCAIYDQCGGCQLQHLSYEEQLIQKQKQVIDNLTRIAGLEDAAELVQPTLGMQEPWRYRNKAQVPIGEQEGGLIGGFYKQGTHEIIDMQECLIQHEQNDAIIQRVKEIAYQYEVSAYDEVKQTGLLRHVVVKYGFYTKECMVVFICNGEEMPHQEEIVQQIIGEFPQVKSIVINSNKRKTNVIFGEETKILWGAEYIYDYIGSLKFAISARSFYQVNPVQTKVLYEKALEYASLEGNETVIDAYCGIGTISLFLAQKAKQVLGVEIVAEAIADAKRNAQLNNIENVQFAVGEAEKIIPWWKAQGITADVIVVDPPRKGCDETLLQTMLEMQPKRIVYVSCNPSTLARDIKVLEAGGYVTQKVQPVDMFPHTSHVECVVQIIHKDYL